MDDGQQLRNILKRQAKSYSKPATRLGDTLSQLMDSRISPQQSRFSSIVELWSQLLPPELYRHCKIADISGNLLKVQVDSPAYMYELRLCSFELLEQLQCQCPLARIKKIKFTIGVES